LVTTDKNIRYTHVEVIKETEVAIIATESNQSSIALWVEALILAKPKIERTVRKHRRPWFAHLQLPGVLTPWVIWELWRYSHCRYRLLQKFLFGIVIAGEFSPLTVS
jgi:hypothetical protein